MKRELQRIAPLLLFILAALTATAQSADPASPATISVPFFVLDGHGQPMTDFDPGSLTILDRERRRQTVVAVSPADSVPLRLGVLIDTSGSEGIQPVYGPAALAALAFMRQQMTGAEDRAFLGVINEAPAVTRWLTKEQLGDWRIDLTPKGRTALFDAVLLACKRMRLDPAPGVRRVLVLLTDGEDNISKAQLGKVISAAQAANTVIFAMQTTTPDQPRIFRAESIYSDAIILPNLALRELASKTGGEVLRLESSQTVADAFSTMGAQIGHMYVASFIPAEAERAGSFQKLKLKVTPRSDVNVRAPSGYIVPETSEGAKQ
jgi:VWFA-related protein